jgi:vancomycin permeability regulator SanA
LSHGSHDEESRYKAFSNAFKTAWVLALTRSTALFVSVYSLINSVAQARSGNATQDLWWIHMGFLPSSVAFGLGVGGSAVLLAYVFAPKMSRWRRVLTLAACAMFAVIALENAAEFYQAWGAGLFRPSFAIPFSVVVAAVFVLLGWGVWMIRSKKLLAADHIAMLLGVAALMILFPLAQIAFFGTSDYRGKADAAVVFGARVFDNGSLSPSLRDRVATAVDLYQSGMVKQLVMSGGVEPNGTDESIAMRNAAEKAGVPASAILLDPLGMDTDATVRNTITIFKREGVHHALAVSQGYHLPRIKLAFLAAGWDVRTVPAQQLEPIWGTPAFIAREIPAFWEYWARAALRQISGGDLVLVKGN